MRYLLLACLLLLTLPVSAEMYRWVDEKGKVHFSDKPQGNNAESYQPKTELLTVPAGQGGGLQPINRPAPTGPAKYKSLRVTAPANDHVFTPDKTASIAVSVSVQPGLNSSQGHLLSLYVDGELYAKGSQFSFNLTGLHRGTHTVQAVITDAKGKRLKSSETVNFHVQKHHL